MSALIQHHESRWYVHYRDGDTMSTESFATGQEAVDAALAADSALYSYFETALWASARFDEEGNDLGPYDDEHVPADMTPEAVAEHGKDLADFLEYAKARGWVDGHEDTQIAHDFWLTRNGHGAGFWDGDYEHGDELTEWAKNYGSCNLYETGDGKVGIQ